MGKHWVRVEKGGNRNVAIFVHGIMGDYKETWGDFPQLIHQDNQLNHLDTICWGYPSSLSPKYLWGYIPMWGSKMPELHSVADALASDLGNPEIGGRYENLHLIGHSMGGLVIKQLIISSLIKISPNNELLDRIRCVVLYATPSDGVELPRIYKIHPQAKSIQCNGDFITSLRNAWVNRVHTVKSHELPEPGKRYMPVTMVLGLEDNAVPRESAASFHLEVETAPGDHINVCKPNNREHTSFQILKREILKYSRDVTQEQPTTSVSDQVLQKADEEPKKPNNQDSGWDYGQFDELASKRDFEGARKIAEKNYASSNMNLELLAFLYWDLITKGWAEGISVLQSLAEDHKESPEVYLWLGLVHARNEHYEKAVDAISRQRDLLVDQSQKLNARRRLATYLALMGRRDLALGELKLAILESNDNLELSKTYKAVGELYIKHYKADIMSGVSCFEKALSLNPLDTELRFRLAYDHTSTITPTLSLYHYEKLIEISPHYGSAENNAGCQASDLKLPFKAMDHFLKAIEQDDTLAMANIALQLIEKGLEKQAREYLDRARNQDGYHDQVDRMFALIGERRQRETHQLEELKQKAKEIIRWRCDEAEALIASPIDPLLLQAVYFDTTGKQINIWLSMEEDQIVGTMSDDNSQMKFFGRVEGRLFRFKWNTNPKTPSTSLLGFNVPSSGSGALISDESATVLRGYRTTTSDEIGPLPWTMRRVIGLGPKSPEVTPQATI